MCPVRLTHLYRGKKLFRGAEKSEELSGMFGPSLQGLTCCEARSERLAERRRWDATYLWGSGLRPSGPLKLREEYIRLDSSASS
jgi:hypothetical protein